MKVEVEYADNGAQFEVDATTAEEAFAQARALHPDAIRVAVLFDA